MPIHLDAEGLTSAAGQLSGTAQAHAPAAAEPPGADVTSLSAVSQLNAACDRLGSGAVPWLSGTGGRGIGGVEHGHVSDRSG